MRRNPRVERIEIDYSRNNGDSCCWSGCANAAGYPAPLHKVMHDNDEPREKLYFCLEHVRAYNSAWDFFGGMSMREIENFQKEAETGHRPTKPLRSYRFRFKADPVFTDSMFADSVFNFTPAAPPEPERKALAVMNLEYPVTLLEIRERYWELAKRHHPDIAKAGDDEFKRIAEAYDLLKKSGHFFDNSVYAHG